MPRISHFIHPSDQSPGVPPVLGTAFATADVHVHDLNAVLAPLMAEKRNFRGIVNGIHIRLSSIGAATTVTVRLCSDAAGDHTLVPDVTATLVPGITTATTACAAFAVGIPLFQLLSSPGNGNLYLFAKVDGGTPSWDQSIITWQE